MRRMKWALAMLLCIAFAWLGGFRAQAQEAAGDVIQEVDDYLTLDPAKYYIFYSAYNENQEPRTARELTIWDHGGNNEGWLRSNTYANSDAYKWSMIATETEGEYRMKNVASNRQVKAESKSLNNKEYAVSHLNTSTAGGAYRFIIKEKKDGKYYVLIQSVTSK